MLLTIKDFVMSLYWRNPDTPLFVIIFGVPFLVVLLMDKVEWKKVGIFIRIFTKYGVVLARHLLRTTQVNINNYAFNFKQFSQAMKVRMKEYEA